MIQLVLIGAGGHCKACIDVIEENKKFSINSILDTEEHIGKQVLKYTINGTDKEINKLAANNYFLITVGQIVDASVRKNLYDLVKKGNGKFATIISPFARVSNYADIGEGTIVMHNAVVNANAKIQENCIINTLANIEHDTIIGPHSHISTGAMVNGNVTIGESCFIGSGAVIAQNVEIASNCIIGAGCVVVRSIRKEGVYFGNPAKFVRDI